MKSGLSPCFSIINHQSSDYIQTFCSIQVKQKADELVLQYQTQGHSVLQFQLAEGG